MTMRLARVVAAVFESVEIRSYRMVMAADFVHPLDRST